MISMDEIWSDIYFTENGINYDYRGLYQISNLGNVKSLNYNKTKREKIMKKVKLKNDYLSISLNKNNNSKKFLIHRLVAHMFCDGYFDGAEVDHINTIRDDNRAEKWKWCTKTENRNNQITKDKYSDVNKKENNPMYGKGRKVVQYDLNNNLIKIWNCIADAQRELKINHISACCRGERKKAGGFVWKYYKEGGDHNGL